jgi:hypothetical protein
VGVLMIYEHCGVNSKSIRNPFEGSEVDRSARTRFDLTDRRRPNPGNLRQFCLGPSPCVTQLSHA